MIKIAIIRKSLPIIFSLIVLCLHPALAAHKDLGTHLQKQSLEQLEEKLRDIDSQLEQLARFTPRGGTGSLGYRSLAHNSPNAMEWIRVELGDLYTLDQIVLVPTLFRESQAGLQSEGFPQAFNIVVGTEETSQVVATFNETDPLLPRIAPLAVSFPAVEASWLSIEASCLSQHFSRNQYILQLSEIIAFSGMENVALHKPVTVSSAPKRNLGQSPKFLTNGFGPYLMDAAKGTQSKTRLIRVNDQQQRLELTIDLKESVPVNQINLHTGDMSLSIPMRQLNTWAVPRHVRITGANDAAFKDATILCEYEQHSIYDNGPIIMRRFSETLCRYIRIDMIDHRPIIEQSGQTTHIGFSEVEVLSNGQNVALETSVTANSGLSAPEATLARLTDGLNYYGAILPLRDWVNQLALRHDLEKARPLILSELNSRYSQQKANLHRLSWLAALLTFGIALAIVIERMRHHRHISEVKERIAADLHDELGANLHSIGILSDLAKRYPQNSDEQLEHLERIRNVTERTSSAVCSVTNLLESKDLFKGLEADMLRTAERIVSKLDHELTIEGNEYLDQLNLRDQIDLFLFYKECLINICRHSGATRLTTNLTATSKHIRLTIIDNGSGMPESFLNDAPKSLQRRARILKSQLTVESPQEGGSSVTLLLRNRRGLRKYIPLFR